MQPIRLRLILAAALAAAAPAVAQEAAAPEAEAPAAETPATEAPATDAPACAAPADPAPAAPADPAPAGEAPAEGGAPGTEGQAAGDPAQREVMEIVRDTFGDWQIRCLPDGDECFMYQMVLDAERNPVSEVTIQKLPAEAEAAAGVIVVTPLGTLLPSGVVLQVDNGERRQYPFAWCTQMGCFSRFGLDEPGVAGMKRGKGGAITLVSASKPEQPVTVELSLTGFTAAYDALEVPTAPAAPEAPAAAAPAQD
jgi:invasion protein IalB